ncbi:hypothetical protein ScPMuIL_004608 [Solemya velum]
MNVNLDETERGKNKLYNTLDARVLPGRTFVMSNDTRSYLHSSPNSNRRRVAGNSNPYFITLISRTGYIIKNLQITQQCEGRHRTDAGAEQMVTVTRRKPEYCHNTNPIVTNAELANHHKGVGNVLTEVDVQSI